MTGLLILCITLLLIILIVMVASKKEATQQYWKGRGDGWVTCENLAMERLSKSFDEDKAHHIHMTLFQ